MPRFCRRQAHPASIMMHQQAVWHAPTRRIFLPSGFVVTMPMQPNEMRALARQERALLEQTLRSRPGAPPHPCAERIVQRLLNQSAAERAAIAHNRRVREEAERTAGLRGACPHELPDRRLQPNVGRNEQVDMVRRMEQHSKHGESMNLDCGLCARDYCRARRWMRGEGIELLDVLPESEAKAKACIAPPQ